MNKNKLFYVIPEYDVNTDKNRMYLCEFIERIAKSVDTAVFIEKCIGIPKINNAKYIYANKFNNRFIKLIERFIVFVMFRIRGFNVYYINNSYFSAIIAGIIAKCSNARMYFWHCELYNKYGEEKTGINKIIWKITDDYLFRIALKLADSLVTGSEIIASKYKSIFGISKIKIVPNYINIDKFNIKSNKVKNMYNISNDHFVILFVHWLSPRKGTSNLAYIAESIIKNNPSCIFLIVGDGPNKLFLQNEINERKIEKNVIITGSVPNKDIPDYFASSNLFIMSSMQEGFPRVLLECMASGVPFVSNDVGCVKEIVPSKQLDYVVDKNNIELFISKINELMNNKEKLVELSKLNKAYAIKYDIDNVIPEFIKEILI